MHFEFEAHYDVESKAWIATCKSVSGTTFIISESTTSEGLEAKLGDAIELGLHVVRKSKSYTFKVVYP